MLCVVGPGHDEARVRDLEVGPRLAGLGRATLQRGQGHLAQVALGGEAVDEEPVGHLAGHLGHELADGGQQDLGVAVRLAPGLKNGVIRVCV